MAVGGGRSRRGAPKLVCVLGVGRTGTNHLFTMLSQVPQVESRFELFNKRAACSLTVDEVRDLSQLLGAGFDLSPEHPDAVREGEQSVAYWRRGDMSYALTGDQEPGLMDATAEALARI